MREQSLTRTDYLEGAHHAHLVVRVKPPRHRGRLDGEPPVERRPALPGRQRREVAPECRIRRRRRVEPPQERPDVEPRAAYDDGQTPASPDRLDRGYGVVTEAGGLISVVGVHDVDEVMDDRSASLGSRLPGRRVHAAIDLPRVGADHFDRYLVSERHRHSGLADARGPADHDNGDLRVLAHRPQCISPNSSRFTRDAPRRCTDSPGTRTGRGRGRSDPFPPRQRRPPRAPKEPRRRGAAHACRVDVSTPTASGPGARAVRRVRHHVRLSSRRMSWSETRLTIGRPCGQKYGVSVAASSTTNRSISSRPSGVFAFTAARHATNASARSSVGTPAPEPANSSTAASINRFGSLALRSAGTARTTIAVPPKPSKAKPRHSRGSRQRSSRAHAAGGRSSGSGKSSVWAAGTPSRTSHRRRSNSTRSWATCWSRKNTSSSEVETTNVSCTWPSTRPKSARVWRAPGSPKSAVCSATPLGESSPRRIPPPPLTSTPGITAGRRSDSRVAAATISEISRGWRKRTHAFVGWTFTSTSASRSVIASSTRGNRSRGSRGR